MPGWFERRRRRRILDRPFAEERRSVLRRRILHYDWLDDAERTLLETLVQIFVAEKTWTPCGGFELTDDVTVTIAGQACLLVLGLEDVLYKNVNEILVYPSTVLTHGGDVAAAAGGMVIMAGPEPILGEALHRGPVVLAWDAITEAAVHPEVGRNVVYHEFAHKLDELSGDFDGVPPIRDPAQYREWVDVCTEEFEELRARVDAGRGTFLDPYATTDPPEFFAVATEYFFDEPLGMRHWHPRLYAVLQAYFNQDPAEREKHGRAAR